MDLPIVIEIVDSEEKVNAFLPDLDEMIGGRVGDVGKDQTDLLSVRTFGGTITRQT